MKYQRWRARDAAISSHPDTSSFFMSQKITTRVIRSEAEIEEIRPLWTGWQRHPNSDIDFYLMIHKLRPNVVRPHIILLYEDGQPRTMLVGRIERGHVDCSIGYKSLIAPKMQIMSFVHGGLLGDASGEAGDAIVSDHANARSGRCGRGTASFPGS